MGTSLRSRTSTSLQRAHIRAPPTVGHAGEQPSVLIPCTRNNLRPALVGTLPALSYAAEPRRTRRWRPHLRKLKTDKRRHDGWQSVFTYSPLTDRRGSVWRLFVPISSTCYSREQRTASNCDR